MLKFTEPVNISRIYAQIPFVCSFVHVVNHFFKSLTPLVYGEEGTVLDCDMLTV